MEALSIVFWCKCSDFLAALKDGQDCQMWNLVVPQFGNLRYTEKLFKKYQVAAITFVFFFLCLKTMDKMDFV